MKRWAAALGLTAAFVSCEGEAPRPRAYRIESMNEAIGGPVADARVGDYVLENDQVRVAIEGGRRSRLFLDVGGTVIDADLVRHDAAYRGGKGLDQLGQIAPVSNLFIGQALEPGHVRVTQSDDGAEVTAASEGGPIQAILSVLGALVARDYVASNFDHNLFRIYNEYELRPGERVLRITSTVGHDLPFCPPEPGDECNAACDDILYDDDCECPEVPARCLEEARSLDIGVVETEPLPDGENRGLLDILIGDLPRPLGSGRCKTDEDCADGEDCKRITTPLGGDARVCRAPDARDAGVALGDMLLFGGNLGLFVPGPGYDSETDFLRLFARGIDTLGNPLPFDAVYAIGQGVSYGYGAPEGQVLVPIFGGSFSFGATGSRACRHHDQGCLAGKLVRSTRFVAVGEGDAASARESLERARGVGLGTISGVVVRDRAGDPVSGADVFAFRDPRDLACDGACAARCGALPDTGGIEAWSIEQLMSANRCRSVDGTFLEGTAKLETAAMTDVGVPAEREGRYRMALPAGRYVLVAYERGGASHSALSAVTVSEGEGATRSFVLPRLGRLEYALFDGFGKPVAGRMSVGACFPGNACGDDADCGGGTVCQAGACACDRTRLKPFEVGGPRYTDGVLAFSQTANGKGTLDLPPGDYEVLFSHGPHHTVDHADVRIEPGVTTQVTGTVFRAVDRAGWVAADFHVHADPSLDSDLPLRERVTSFLSEDLDFLSSSDHDIHTSYEPLLEEMGVRDELGAQVGVEVSTQEIGHFIGWPLVHRQWKDGERVPGNGALDWRGLAPQEIFDGLRALRGPGPEVVVEVPHPYSYFDYYNLDPVTLEPSETLLAAINPLLGDANFSGDFDTMEVMNGKGFDYLRRPTIGELREYSQAFDALRRRRASGEIDEATYERLVYQLSVETNRRVLHRTPDEQAASLAGDGNDVRCLCGSDGDCAAGSVCDPATLECVSALDFDGGDGDTPGSAGLCRRFRGVVDDWFNMLNRGVRRTVVGGSDTHGIYDGEAGVPRTMMWTGGTTGPSLQAEDIVGAVRRGEVVVTNGPMVHFTLDGARVGSTVPLGGDGKVSLALRVETAPWYDVDRIEVYRNGELIHWLSGCGASRDGDAVDPHDHPCIPPSDASPLAYEGVLEDEPTEDAWYAVIVLGLDGRSLAPVYSSRQTVRVGTFEVAQKIFDIIPALASFRTPRFPVLYPTFPVAVTNPIWVDVDGDGFQPKDAPPSWCRAGVDQGCD